MLSARTPPPPPPPTAPNRPINTSEPFSVFSRVCLRQLLVVSPSQRMRFKIHQINGSKNSLTHFRGEGGWWGVGGGEGWAGLGQVLFCLCLMSCTMHPSEWKQVMYCCKKCLWRRAALLLTDSAGAFNRCFNKIQILSCGAE